MDKINFHCIFQGIASAVDEARRNDRKNLETWTKRFQEFSQLASEDEQFVPIRPNVCFMSVSKPISNENQNQQEHSEQNED